MSNEKRKTFGLKCLVTEVSHKDGQVKLDLVSKVSGDGHFVLTPLTDHSRKIDFGDEISIYSKILTWTPARYIGQEDRQALIEGRDYRIPLFRTIEQSENRTL